MKILLVEDSRTIRYAMCKYIGEAGHETLVAESGEEALQLLDTTPVDMVIMDVEMPGLDGFETTRLIREWLGDHWIPIIFVTGKSEASSLEEGIAAGGDDYLIKPVNQVILNAKISAMERITEMRNQLAKLNDELTELSQKDGLTQLYNRRTFKEKGEELWALSTRNKKPVTVLLLDIDYFKPFNDRYGHPAGDECIRQVARVLTKCMNRSADLVARYGGEEFVALLPDTPEAGAEHMCELIRGAIENLKVKHQDSAVSTVVTVSIGASVINYTTGTTLDVQIDLADKALYEAKHGGRNQVVVREYNPQNRVLIVDEDERALESLSRSLTGHCALITTTQTEECMALAEEYYPDVIIIDADSKHCVRELCQSLRENIKIKSIPLVLIGTMTTTKLKNLGSDAEVEGYLSKPLDIDRLVALVSQYLN